MRQPPYPKWVLNLPAGRERDKAEHRFLVFLVELYSGRGKDLRRVARMLGIPASTLLSRVSPSRGSALKPHDRHTLLRRYAQYTEETP